MKIRFKKYYHRKQPKNREHLGKLETKSEMKKRLENERKRKQKLKEIKEEIENKNPLEYNFKMYSVDKNFTKKQIYKKADILNLDLEIRRIELKLKKILPDCKTKKIDLESGDVIENRIYNENYNIYNKYLNDLKTAREEMVKLVDKK